MKMIIAFESSWARCGELCSLGRGRIRYSARWQKTDLDSSGTWYYANEVILQGTIAPNPGGGIVRIRLDFENQQARWITVDCASDGTFTWSGHPSENSRILEAIARFEGNRKFRSSLSNAVKLNAPPVIR